MKSVALLLAGLFLLVPLASASHPVTDDGRTVSFFHPGTGNEWWVEVYVQGADGSTVATVEARDADGPWTHLQKQSWGAWAKSFHVEPGSDVRFRATWSDGDRVRSCWFTHPAGVEQCSAPPPPRQMWPTSIVGDAGSPNAGRGDMAVGDADNDGRRDVTIATWAGIYTFEDDGAGWARQRVGSSVSLNAMAVGDGDGDGLREIYAMSNETLVQARFVAGAWSERALLSFPENFAGDMTLGNIDGQPGPEIYVGIGRTECLPEAPAQCSTDSYIYRVRSVGDAWEGTRIFSSGGHIQSIWIGDGDNDGEMELYVGRTSRAAESKSQVKFEDGAWRTTDLPGSIGTGSQVVVGDVDRDGRHEVYTASFTGEIGMVAHDPATGNWTYHHLIDTGAADRLFIGDADSDGRQNLYVGTYDGEVYQISFTEGQWTQARIARPFDSARQSFGDSTMLVVADGDGDARNEVYAGITFRRGFDDRLARAYRIGEPASNGFDATFTGVRGNEWWVQADVKASGGTLSKVDVRLDEGAWKPLAKQSWGVNAYAASYHIAEGTVVQLRATSTTGATDQSDCYRWIPQSGQNAAKTACGSAPPPPSDFDASFRTPGGNEWWVEVYVDANEPIASVHARDDGGAWVALEKKSWGAWAKSFHVQDGFIVEFRATSADGDTDISGGYHWPSGTPA